MSRTLVRILKLMSLPITVKFLSGMFANFYRELGLSILKITMGQLLFFYYNISNRNHFEEFAFGFEFYWRPFDNFNF